MRIFFHRAFESLRKHGGALILIGILLCLGWDTWIEPPLWCDSNKQEFRLDGRAMKFCKKNTEFRQTLKDEKALREAARACKHYEQDFNLSDKLMDRCIKSVDFRNALEKELLEIVAIDVNAYPQYVDKEHGQGNRGR